MLLQPPPNDAPKRRPLWSSRKCLMVFLIYLSGFLVLIVCGGFLVELNPVERGVVKAVPGGWTVKPVRGEGFSFKDPLYVCHSQAAAGVQLRLTIEGGAKQNSVYQVKEAESSLQVQDDGGDEIEADTEVYVVFRALKLWQFIRLGLGL